MTKNRRDTYKLLRALLLLIGIQTALICVMMLVGKTSNVDMLVYSMRQNRVPIELVLYDPHHHIHFTAFTNISVPGFGVSAAGRIAFMMSDNLDSEVVVWNSQSPYGDPLRISRNLLLDWFWIPVWSHDQRSLAFVGSSDSSMNRDQLYIWDGETIYDIALGIDSLRISNIDWSFDGRLAFAGYDEIEGNEEVYIWDGHNTVNLSQNPDTNDSAPTWNTDGRLAFHSWQANYSDIFLWDGVSIANGIPDNRSFTNVGATFWVSAPEWTNRGLLAFIGTPPGERGRQTLIWDGQTMTIVNPSADDPRPDSIPTWSADGHWAYSTSYYSVGLVVVYDVNNRIVLSTHGQGGAAWNSHGYLIFCNEDALQLWDGQTITTIADGLNIVAQWQSGAGIHCFGN